MWAKAPRRSVGHSWRSISPALIIWSSRRDAPLSVMPATLASSWKRSSPPGARVRWFRTSNHPRGTPAPGSRSFSRAAVIVLWARARPSHRRAVSTSLVFGICVGVNPMTDRPPPGVASRRSPPHARGGESVARFCLGGGGFGHLDDDLGVDGELDGVARERDRAGDSVPVEPEVHAVDLSGRADAQALAAAERVGQPALDGAGQLDRPGGLLDREVAADAVVLVVDLLDAGDAEGQVRVLLGVEEVGGLEVGVALVVAGAEAGDLDLDRAARLGHVVVGALEAPVELREVSVDRGHGQMLGGEPDVRVSRIDFVANHCWCLLRFSYSGQLACAINYSCGAGIGAAWRRVGLP